MTSKTEIDATSTSPPPAATIGVPARSSTEHAFRAGRPSAPQWRRSYSRRLWASDLVALIWVVYGTQIVWLGFGDVALAVNSSRVDDVSYWYFSAALVVAWMISLSLLDTRSDRVVGTGNLEYVRIVQSSLRLFGLIAILAFLLRVDVARGYLLISLPLGIVMLCVERWLWRQWLVSKRALHQYSARVLLIGSASSVSTIAHELARAPGAGYHVVGACVPSGRIADVVPGTDIPVMGSVDAVGAAIAATGADTIAVTSTDELPPHKVKEISWGLVPGRQHLVLAPSIVDIAGPRIHSRPVAGLPLIHVETPRFTRGQRLVKRSFDLLSAAVLITVLSPLLIVVAVTVRITSPGPVFFRQKRIGLDGTPFHMMKFRSMRVGADTELAALLMAQGTSEVPLFKVRDDPRITSIGGVLRKYSLDELPQLFNVLAGSMSLVGPRPQIEAEVALYTSAHRRRLLTRPGITGLWQVSGRSTLDWTETVRLDLYYVENWSLAGDIAILFRTVRAVVAPGATAQ